MRERRSAHVCCLFLLVSLAPWFLPTHVQALTLLHSFKGSEDGSYPNGSLVLSGDGATLYGMTYQGGASDHGVIFSMPVGGGTSTLLHEFAGGATDGAHPNGSLILSGDGATLYGMTEHGGTSEGDGLGVIFAIPVTAVPGDPITLLHKFAGGTTDGAWPHGSLILAGGTLYGMATSGGDLGLGVIFSIPVTAVPGDPITLLHKFAGGTTDGAWPNGSLILAGGTLYGMTYYGGNMGVGVIFSIPVTAVPADPITLLHHFVGFPTDGSGPYGSLILSGGTLYGMTSSGGASNYGVIFSIPAAGGSIRLLHEFAGLPTDGASPRGNLILSGSGSRFYGMTANGGELNLGVIFSIPVAGGPIRLVHEFGGVSEDGAYPYGSLILSRGTLYGMTYSGGAWNVGCVFSTAAAAPTVTPLFELLLQ